MHKGEGWMRSFQVDVTEIGGGGLGSLILFAIVISPIVAVVMGVGWVIAAISNFTQYGTIDSDLAWDKSILLPANPSSAPTVNRSGLRVELSNGTSVVVYVPTDIPMSYPLGYLRGNQNTYVLQATFRTPSGQTFSGKSAETSLTYGSGITPVYASLARSEQVTTVELVSHSFVIDGVQVGARWTPSPVVTNPPTPTGNLISIYDRAHWFEISSFTHDTTRIIITFRTAGQTIGVPPEDSCLKTGLTTKVMPQTSNVQTLIVPDGIAYQGTLTFPYAGPGTYQFFYGCGGFSNYPPISLELR